MRLLGAGQLAKALSSGVWQLLRAPLGLTLGMFSCMVMGAHLLPSHAIRLRSMQALPLNIWASSPIFPQPALRPFQSPQPLPVSQHSQDDREETSHRKSLAQCLVLTWTLDNGSPESQHGIFIVFYSVEDVGPESLLFLVYPCLCQW